MVDKNVCVCVCVCVKYDFQLKIKTGSFSKTPMWDIIVFRKRFEIRIRKMNFMFVKVRFDNTKHFLSQGYTGVLLQDCMGIFDYS